jgi:pimeloyl-ACP methyl ester carboxylesterase
MPTLERDGVRIHYEVAGPADTGRLPLLLSHGYGATAAMWEPNLAELAADRRVVSWDLRGHGDTDSPPDPGAYSEAAAVADMAAILDAVGIERAALGGLSLGGYLSLAFRLAHPERVAALLLFDTGPGFRRDEARARWNETAEARAKALETKGLDALSSSPETRRGRHDPAGLAHAARGILAQRDARVMDSLASIDVPTLVLVGSEDQPFLAAADYMASHIAGARRVVIEGAGHASNLDQPAAFNRAVREFLDTLDAG